ncbi:ABC transporter substrate-binding protein [Rossellomorea vietnamensis]|uniref:ABC transporter substrate-binding protein n=1 Tax=Rossellomorea vietnamensis TaxID=218284 RepID=A0A5D4NLV4_9BACI|nr:ABC transporter substrate-binding protein [Rossellomorea vietnamensis]TYS14491.1 ABC transporter substrate-binding protein [Rossellomorea vietnamensis]
MKKRSLAMLLSLVLLMSGFLAGCGNDEGASANVTEDGKKVVDFWTFWGSETRKPMIEKIIKDFNESQDEIVVKHTYLPWGDIWTKNLASIAAGDPADVIINDINSVAQRAENEQVEDLSEYIGEDFKEQYYPHLWDTVEYEGKPYAVPFNTDTRMLFYNKEAFKEAGLDPEQPPKTWEELEEYAQKLDVKDGDRYERVGFYPLWGSIGANSWMVNGDEGQKLVEDGEVFINTPRKVEAIEWIKSWKDRIGDKTVQSFQAEFGSQQSNPFISGKVAMWVNVGNFYTEIKEFGQDMDFGVAPVPAYDESSKPWSDGGGFVAEIPKGADNPEAAAEFIKYLTGEEAQKYWAMQNFDNVANAAAAEQAAEELEGKDKEIYQATIDNLEFTQLHPMPVEYPDYQNLLNPKVDEFMMGSLEAEEALKSAQESVEKMKR